MQTEMDGWPVNVISAGLESLFSGPLLGHFVIFIGVDRHLDPGVAVGLGPD